MTTLVQISRPGDPYLIYGAKADGTPSLLRDGLGMPARRARIAYMPDSKDVDGSEAYAAAWDQGELALKIRLEAGTELAFQVAYGELVDAIGQFSYTTTVTLGRHTTAWACDRGSIELANQARQWFDNGLVVEYFAVTIPVYPIPTS